MYELVKQHQKLRFAWPYSSVIRGFGGKEELLSDIAKSRLDFGGPAPLETVAIKHDARNVVEVEAIPVWFCEMFLLAPDRVERAQRMQEEEVPQAMQEISDPVVEVATATVQEAAIAPNVQEEISSALLPLECSICFHAFNERSRQRCILNPCLHKETCMSCILKIVDTNSSCPVCRTQITDIVDSHSGQLIQVEPKHPRPEYDSDELLDRFGEEQDMDMDVDEEEDYKGALRRANKTKLRPGVCGI